ncbi:unnamed protein product [Protopolystoma xenopodis]|uniref:Uncharacterized protein n=1 Tax=Protopolystoma xenopodis TaxID=117903 RepID=A0A3S5ARN3_9PLAT|nr:unnamed protein product [Protopolystoma xenopodis]
MLGVGSYNSSNLFYSILILPWLPSCITSGSVAWSVSPLAAPMSPTQPVSVPTRALPSSLLEARVESATLLTPREPAPVPGALAGIHLSHRPSTSGGQASSGHDSGVRLCDSSGELSSLHNDSAGNNSETITQASDKASHSAKTPNWMTENVSATQLPCLPVNTALPNV